MFWEVIKKGLGEGHKRYRVIITPKRYRVTNLPMNFISVAA